MRPTLAHIRRLAASVLVLLLAPPFIAGAHAAPPEPGGAEVSVLDPSGAAVPGARVTLKPAGGGPAIAARQGAPGVYRAAGLAPDRYLVSVAAERFLDARAALTVAPGAGADAALAVALRPAPLAESVTVHAERVPDATTLKLPLPLHDTPRAVTVVGETRLREDHVRFVNDAITLAPGMAVNSFRTGGYHFYARGYRMGPEDTRIDGFAGINAGGRYSASTFGIEQVVLLRGPAGLFYGPSRSPGGMVNLVTKQPQAQASTRVEMRAATYAGQGVDAAERPSVAFDFDTTGPLTRDRRVLYRLLATTERMNYFTGGVLDRNRYVQGKLTLALDAAGAHRLTPLVQWTRFRRPQGGGLVASPSTSLATNDGLAGPIALDDLTPLDVNLSSGGGVDDTLQAGLSLDSTFASGLHLAGAYRYVAYDTSLDQWTPEVTSRAQMALLRDQGLVDRARTRSDTERRTHAADVNLSRSGHLLGAASLWQVGINANTTSTRRALAATPAARSRLDVFSGRLLTPADFSPLALAFEPWEATNYWNAYAQNRTTLLRERVVLTTGLGYARGTAAAGAEPSGALVPNAGVLFHADRSLALYFSYSSSYNPVDPSLEDARGRAGVFGPSVGRNFELGAKYDLGRRVSASLALFDNRLDNAVVLSGANDLNPRGNRYASEGGTRHARGAELTAELRPAGGWAFEANAAYLDATYAGDGPRSVALPLPGSRAEKSPRWSFGARARYDVTAGPLRGAGAWLAWQHQGTRYGSNGARTTAAPDPLLLPAFTRLDLGLSYPVTSHLDVGLRVENLLDEVIFVNGSVGSSLELAAPRNVALRLGWNF